jgi:hypothetical protein
MTFSNTLKSLEQTGKVSYRPKRAKQSSWFYQEGSPTGMGFAQTAQQQF